MKRLMTIIMALAFAAASSQVLAASTKCSVTAVNDGKIILDCGTKADSFKIGDEVKIRTAKTQKKAIEGC